MVLFYPLIWVAKRWYPKFSLPGLFLGAGLLLFPVAIYFSFTRIAIGLLLLYPIIFGILHFRLLRPAMILAAIAIVVGITYLLSERTYLKYAPNYERTIYQDEFGNLLEATYKLEDLSTMERVHRWVAARHMTVDHPWLGTGPGTFHPTYKKYTVKSFSTYMSDNPEQSGVHNYYLMTLTDQGWPGLIFWLILVAGSLLFMEQLYHSGRLRPADKQLLGALFCIFSGLLVINVMNDMIEHFKIGGLFFWVLALVGLLSYGHHLAPDPK
jgi:O-antigen ligase